MILECFTFSSLWKQVFRWLFKSWECSVCASVPPYALPVGASHIAWRCSCMSWHIPAASLAGEKMISYWQVRYGVTIVPAFLLTRHWVEKNKETCKLEVEKMKATHHSIYTVCVCVQSILTTWAGARKPALAPYSNQMLRRGRKAPQESCNQNSYLYGWMFTKC